MTEEFWVTNISNRNVSLADLNLTIKAFSSVNLLDNRHYNYTLQQLEKSYNEGSIAAKRDKIIKRNIAPEVIKLDIPFIKETYIPTRERSTYVIQEEQYEELNLTDEKFAEENAEMAELDCQPLVIKETTHVTSKTTK